MKQVFSLLTAFTITMILLVGGGVYWWSNAKIDQAKELASTAIVNTVALTLSEQIALLSKTLEKIAEDPEVLTAMSSGDPASLATVATKLEKFFPDALKIRLLLPDVIQLDEKNSPRMGFADIDMVHETLNNNQSPGIQGYEGADRHLAITRRITNNGQVVGVILASLNYDFFKRSIEAAALKDGYIELRQEKMILGASGKRDDSRQSESLQKKVENTSWELFYQYPVTTNLAQTSYLIIIITTPILLSLLAFLIGYRRIAALMARN